MPDAPSLAPEAAPLTIEYRSTADLRPYDRNPRKNANAVAKVAASLREFGFRQPIVVDEEGVIVVGHTRWLAAQELALPTVPVHVAVGLTPEQLRAYRIADNRTNEEAEWDNDLLAGELNALREAGVDLAMTAFDSDELVKLLSAGAQADEQTSATLTLAERFGVPPFSVLEARQGYWQKRKKAWLALGIQSEIGRGENLLKYSDVANKHGPGGSKGRAKAYNTHGSIIGNRAFGEEYEGGDAWAGAGTSIFDPVLCEIATRWFCPPNGMILDPFAGGSVRGVVAGLLSRQYVGIDLREEQVEANRVQASILVGGKTGLPIPQWHVGDSLHMDSLLPTDFECDLLFSCPPYVDLEVYSDDPSDLSNMPYEQFLDVYRSIIAKGVARMREHSFAVWVVGEVRGPDGHAYHGFVPDTVKAFTDAGATYYNEAILVTAVGSAAIRAGGMFTNSRKLCKTHQNVLVFCKGDPKVATERIGTVEFGDIAHPELDPATNGLSDSATEYDDD